MKLLKYTDKWLLAVSLILFIFGLIMIFSASNVAAFMRYDKTPYLFLERTLFILAVGMVLSFVIIHFNTKVYSLASWPLLVAIIVALIAVLVYGKITNESRSWFPIGSFNFQPSEFAKVIIIVWMASFYELKRNSLNSIFTSIFPLIICILIFALTLKQPDLGTALIGAAIVMFIFFIVPVKLNIKLKSVFIVGIVGVLILLYSGGELLGSRQHSRFDFDNPCSEEKFYDSGNQICNAYIAINNGGLFGRGLGNSTQKYLYLPEAHTDFIFAIIVEELGLVTAVILLLMYIILLFRIVIIGRRSVSSRGSIMCYGVAVYIFLHIIVNLMGIMGLIPMTGVPLPFMSYAGGFTICLLASLGIVQRVNIETKLAMKMRNS